MTGNRVEKLESRVEELEASVAGLTEELMQTKSRLAEVEDGSTEASIETDLESPTKADADPTDEPESDTPTNEAHKSTEDEEATTSRQPDDIIVA